MVENQKTVADTHMSKETVQAIVSAAQMKHTMLEQTRGRYMVKSIMAGFLLAIVTVFMFAMKTQFEGAHPGLINLLGALSFSLALVLIVLTHSELLTSNFMYLTVGWYYKAVSWQNVWKIFIYCFIGNIIGGFILFFMMRLTHIMTPEMITALSTTVEKKTVASSWLEILNRAIFANFFINIGIYVSLQFKDGFSKLFFIAAGVVVFVFMGYEHVVFNTGLYAGMVFFNLQDLVWLDVGKNVLFAFIGNFIGGGLFVGFIYAYLNGKRHEI